MSRTLRASLIRTAWENPGPVRRAIVALLREAREYEDYVEEKKRKGEKPLSKKDWESYGKGKKKLDDEGVDTEKLREALPDMPDKAFDDLVAQAATMEPEQIDEWKKMLGNKEELSEWAKGNLPDSVKDYVEKNLPEEDDDDKATLDEALADLTTDMFDWFSDFVRENKG